MNKTSLTMLLNNISRDVYPRGMSCEKIADDIGTFLNIQGSYLETIIHSDGNFQKTMKLEDYWRTYEEYDYHTVLVVPSYEGNLIVDISNGDNKVYYEKEYYINFLGKNGKGFVRYQGVKEDYQQQVCVLKNFKVIQ